MTRITIYDKVRSFVATRRIGIPEAIETALDETGYTQATKHRYRYRLKRYFDGLCGTCAQPRGKRYRCPACESIHRSHLVRARIMAVMRGLCSRCRAPVTEGNQCINCSETDRHADHPSRPA